MVFAAGATGTEEHLSFEQKNRVYEPTTLTKDITDIIVYFDQSPEPEWIEKLKIFLPESNITLEKQQNQDWLKEWKKGFQPFCLAGDVWVVPSWCEPPREARQIIHIDPGMAFGTGTHETTRLAASFIFDFARQSDSENSVSSLLDVGTGTGILSILARLVGFKNVIGNDIDEEARRVARENLILNKAHDVTVVNDSLENIRGQFDWVVANIIDGVLIELQSDLRKKTKSGGYLLLTGIMQERESLFQSDFVQQGLDLVERRQLGDWVGYLFKKMERA